jgi:hypothetical protein
MLARFWLGSLRGRYHLKVLCTDGRIILEWNLQQKDGRMRIGSIHIKTGTSMSTCKHGTVPLGSITGREFLS